jgi:hypothetical protein
VRLFRPVRNSLPLVRVQHPADEPDHTLRASVAGTHFSVTASISNRALCRKEKLSDRLPTRRTRTASPARPRARGPAGGDSARALAVTR